MVWIYFASYLCLHNMVLGKINITQYPHNLTISNGNTVKMTCQWNSEDDQQVRVQWRKQSISTGEENGTLLCTVRWTEQGSKEVVNNTSTCNLTNNTAMLTIDRVTEEDHGIYVCEVIIEIPKLVKGRGDGTQLLVQGYNSGSPKEISLVGVVAIFPILALTVYFLYKRNKENSKKMSEKNKQEHIELTQRHQEDAAVAEEDSSSTNSVTWAVSTLYESFDYFALKNPHDKAATSCTAILVKPETTEEYSLTAV
ncbi:hypothetical protein PRIEUP_LOCUS16526 [Pristimantis euphronides]